MYKDMDIGGFDPRIKSCQFLSEFIRVFVEQHWKDYVSRCCYNFATELALYIGLQVACILYSFT